MAPALVQRRRAVELDLSVDLGALQHGALDPVGIVLGHRVAQRRQVGHGAAHGHQRLGLPAAGDARQVLFHGNTSTDTAPSSR